MPAQAWESVLLLVVAGELGRSSRDGRETRETSDGQKPWASNSSSTHSSAVSPPIRTSASTETIKASLTGGSEVKVATSKSMTSSSVYRSFYTNTGLASSSNTFPAQTTQQMAPREAFSHPNTSSYLPSPFPSSFAPSFSTPITGALPAAYNNIIRASILSLTPSQNPFETSTASPQATLSSLSSSVPNTSSASATLISERTDATPPTILGRNLRALAAGHTISSSWARPACPAKDRIYLWRPSSSAPIDPSLTSDDALFISGKLSKGLREKTLAGYGSGLMLFHIMCDTKNIPEAQCAPASRDLISLFLAEMIGWYAKSTINNYLWGLRAWHTVHRFDWAVDETQLATMLQAAANLEPESSTRPPREPYTIDILTRVVAQLSHTDSLDVAVSAAALSLFWGMGRASEHTVPTLKSFDPAIHVQLKHISEASDRSSRATVTNIHIPYTKCGKTAGEDIFWAPQPGPLCPDTALKRHILINTPAPTEHLFVHTHRKGRAVSRRPLSKAVFIARLRKAAVAAGINAPPKGHAFRIRGTLEYLLRGVPFDVVKAKGRWASDAFRVYLRKHASIMAPYVQADPLVQESIVRYSMPPVR